MGKTSLITYLAERVGQRCYRINNHEHTDQQTYLGTYSVASCSAPEQGSATQPDNGSALVFKEGPLVQAMRDGHWIILDELNLAPTDILEALNRVGRLVRLCKGLCVCVFTSIGRVSYHSDNRPMADFFLAKLHRV